MRTWRLFSVFAVLALVLAACGPSGTSPSAGGSDAPESEGAAPSEGTAFEPAAYPADGPAECGADNNPSNISEIRAEDEHTVVFTLCAPDVAFLPKIAFSAFGIDDTAWLEEHGADGSIVDNVERHRAVPARRVEPRQRHHPDRLRRLLGRCAAQLDRDLPLEHGGRPAARRAPGRIGRRHRQPRRRRLRDDRRRRQPRAVRARGPEHPVLRVQQQPVDRRLRQQHEPVRRRGRAPGDCHGHRPPGDRGRLLPAGIRGRQPLHPVRHPVRMRGRRVVRVRP